MMLAPASTILLGHRLGLRFLTSVAVSEKDQKLPAFDPTARHFGGKGQVDV
jgi:hypothetical protein